MRNFTEAPNELLAVKFSRLNIQLLVVNLRNMEPEFRHEVAELQFNRVSESLSRSRGTLSKLDEVLEKECPKCTSHAEDVIAPFPSPYSVLRGFGSLSDLVSARRNRIGITSRVDLRLILSS